MIICHVSVWLNIRLLNRTKNLALMRQTLSCKVKKSEDKSSDIRINTVKRNLSFYDKYSLSFCLRDSYICTFTFGTRFSEILQRVIQLQSYFCQSAEIPESIIPSVGKPPLSCNLHLTNIQNTIFIILRLSNKSKQTF